MGRKFAPFLVSAAFVLSFAGAPPAHAETAWWKIVTAARPTNLPPGGEGVLDVSVSNLGDATADAGGESPVTVTDTLPPGLTVIGVGAEKAGEGDGIEGVACSVVSASSVTCTYAARLGPYQSLGLSISVAVTQGASSGAGNTVDVSGGEIASASVVQPVAVGGAPAKFGVERYELTPSNEDGSFDTQAGSHPFQLTSTIEFNSEIRSGGRFPGPYPVGFDRDLHFELPPGEVGDPNVVPQCSVEEFSAFGSGRNSCPADTAIGVAEVTVGIGRPETYVVPVFNLPPTVGEPARFGFFVEYFPVFLDTSVRTGGGYGVTVDVNNLPEVLPTFGSQVTFWGVPGDPRHNQSRGWECLNGYYGALPESCGAGVPSQTAFLSMPTSCNGLFESTVLADSYEQPNSYVAGQAVLRNLAGTGVGLDGCNRLNFNPSISVAPDGQAASTPTGLTVNLHVPQTQTLNPAGLAQANVKSTTVTLPAGVQLSPSAADGLLACSDEQVGFTGVSPQTDEADFTPVPATCPDASKVGTVRISTPLLPNPLKGSVYLAAQDANPFGSLVALYIEAEEPISGVLVKLAGEVALNPVTGQAVATFDHTPQVPFEDLALEFFGSARAPLTTPPLCGTYTTQTSIAPWSGNPAATPSSSFQITGGPNGAPCSNPQPFAPGFEAGSTNLQAGAFTPFALTMTRPDADQTLSRIEMQMPPGLLGTLSNVKLCPEPQAALGTCGEESLIGHTVVSAGLGGDPYTVTGGKVYITTGYKGAPYGLSIVNPAKAGPFDLGTVVVRATINVDPHTAALSIKSDPLPTILDGIPLQIQHVNVSVDREKFTFNPTNCGKTAITGTLSSSEGSAAAVSTSFQVTNCATLAFQPKLTVSTAGKTSRANGASLHVRLTYPEGPYDANIASVKVELPKRLPSRLTTLQKACPAATFEANPASCPAASLIGSATATTPVLPVPLTGPAYFVSHGGEAFPSLIVVLQGYGVTVDLVGTTFISKTGITSSTFKTVPDVPVGTFELTLPEGKYSALAANGNLCTGKLTMPTLFVGQNGAQTHETTAIKATGCPRHKAARSRRKHHKR